MSDVKRYDCYGKDALGYDYPALSREAIDGDWVLAEDHIAECDALRARLAEVISERDDLRTMLLNERNERATDSEVNPRHICGAQGYNPMIDPPCPACTPDSATPRETASHE